MGERGKRRQGEQTGETASGRNGELKHFSDSPVPRFAHSFSEIPRFTHSPILRFPAFTPAPPALLGSLLPPLSLLPVSFRLRHHAACACHCPPQRAESSPHQLV